MRAFNKALSILSLTCLSGVLASSATATQNVDELIEQWKKLEQRIERLKVPRNDVTKVIYHKDPFEYVEAIENTKQPGRLPIRGVAFDLPKSRVVIIQNLFDTAGASLSDYAKLQFAKMLRSLLPRPALQRAFEIEVRGFTDIQTFGDPLNLKNCNIKKPNNNACLGKARAANTSIILKSYIKQTLGAGLPLIQKYDPDPVMVNLNIQSEGKVWKATGAEPNVKKIAKLFAFEPQLNHELSVEEILEIRKKASKKARALRREIEDILQPFRCAIVIAWRS